MKRISLPHKKILRFVGKDAQTFIQGLFSNDVLSFSSSENSDKNNNIVYGAFLNGNGRVVTDAFVFFEPSLLSDPSNNPSNELFAEIDGTHAETPAKLIRHLDAFKMRADVKISIMEDANVDAVLLNIETNEQEQQQQQQQQDEIANSFQDPRASLEKMKRVFYRHHHDQQSTTKNGEINEYFEYLYQRGICEGDKLWSSIRLPFEGNLDIVGGIHYRKGCYIGQELVQRAKSQLVSRKRIVPFQSSLPLAIGTDLFKDEETSTEKKPGALGKVIDCVTGSASTNNHIGVCSLRLQESLDAETLEAKLTTKQGDAKVTASIPFWWPDDEIDKCIPLEGEETQSEQE
jgi:folate-binding protein YgfZ